MDQPFSGKVGEDSLCQEDKIGVIFYSYLKSQILSSLKEVHPYQEVAILLIILKMNLMLVLESLENLKKQ